MLVSDETNPFENVRILFCIEKVAIPKIRLVRSLPESFVKLDAHSKFA